MSENKRILLHVCCGPCATASIERLIEDGWTVDLFFSNSNIAPRDEYDRRLKNAEKTAEAFGLRLIEDEYDHDAWLSAVKGFEDEPERGARCEICFRYSLGRAAAYAKDGGYDGFTTTLSISPHKDSKLLYEVGNSVGKTGDAGKAGKFVEYNFKKKNGFKRSIELADELELYRQDYCGCEFSIR